MTSTTDTALHRKTRGLFRIMLSGIFLVAGLNHLTNTEATAQRLEAAPFGYLATSIADPHFLVLLAAGPLIVGGVMLLVGFQTRWAGAVLMAMIVGITLSIQIGDAASLGPLFKNIGLMGALLYFTTHGSRDWSIDGWRAKSATPATSK